MVMMYHSRDVVQPNKKWTSLSFDQIGNFCPVISRHIIVKSSISIEYTWKVVRLHSGFQATAAHFIDLADIHLEPHEHPEDLYQWLMAFVEDNLLRNNCTNHSKFVGDDEELSPTLDNLIVFTWLRLIHSGLPKLVKQRYGTEFKSRTLASIKTEILQALGSLL